MNDITQYNENIFESIRHVNERGQEYWDARELRKVLKYTEYNKFVPVIKRAIRACKGAGNTVSDHFAEVSEMVDIGSGASREMPSYHLTRYACYLIVMNGDSRKKTIALGQTYFAVKTREQEIEDQKRIGTRKDIKYYNKRLANAAHDAGVETGKDYATFQNAGYQGLYGGLTAKGIKKRKGIDDSENILDHMSGTELAANLFRITQTEEKLRKDGVHDKKTADDTHYKVGRIVRQTIKKLGGTMPEELPASDTSIKQIEREQKKKS